MAELLFQTVRFASRRMTWPRFGKEENVVEVSCKIVRSRVSDITWSRLVAKKCGRSAARA